MTRGLNTVHSSGDHQDLPFTSLCMLSPLKHLDTLEVCLTFLTRQDWRPLRTTVTRPEGPSPPSPLSRRSVFCGSITPSQTSRQTPRSTLLPSEPWHPVPVRTRRNGGLDVLSTGILWGWVESVTNPCVQSWIFDPYRTRLRHRTDGTKGVDILALLRP